MRLQITRTGILGAALAIFYAVLLTGCGAGDEGASNESVTTEVSGSVGDGPVTGATVEIYNIRGELVSTETSDYAASYKTRLKLQPVDYPLLLEVSDGVDLVTGEAPDFEMVSVILDKSGLTANINPFSTLIVKMAESMAGGLNTENVDYAKTIVMDKYSFGLDQAVINDPVTNRISSKNIANIVKSSEVLGEMIRRTRDAISATGAAITGDDVVNAIAADMADGLLDGTGASGSDATIAAVANVVSGQVLVEAMTNELKVNGVNATLVIDHAISITHPSTRDSQMSGSVLITSGLGKQTKLSVDAARVIDSSSDLVDLVADIDRISPNSTAKEASSVLSDNASQKLDNAITQTSTAATQEVIAINMVASNTLPLVPETITPPVIEESPPPVVEETTPPVVEETTPPVVEETTPPVVEETTPPVVEETTPPVVEETTPPVVEETTPPVVEETTPPVVEEKELARVTDNLVAFYPFVERAGNVVRDLSGSATPMDLAMTGSVSWYGAGNGVVMNGGRIGTTGPATELINALRASNSSTFEAWVEPGDLTQLGPARIISVGEGWNAQNFMLGQAADNVEARLLHTGKESMLTPRIRTDNGVLDGSLVHLAHVYDGAVERMYINGVQYGQTAAVSGGYSNWNMLHQFSIGNEASLDRPYNGVIRMVAVYDRPLSEVEIQQNYSAGPAPDNVSGMEGANYVPVISGEPATSVTTIESYDFQPVASDADGDKLEFSISGMPAWASFDTATGRLNGTPGIDDVGTYSNIVISVTDGADEIALAPFSIQVNEYVQLGSLSLSWSAPTMRSDGTPLSQEEINGYRIYYGEYEGEYTESVKITNGKARSATLDDIPVGNYYVAMTTYDIDGRESGHSMSVFKAVQ